MPAQAAHDVGTDAAWANAGVYVTPKHWPSLGSREPSPVILRIPHHGARLVVEREIEKPWLNSAIPALSKILRLPPNWDSYQARPVVPRAVAGVLSFLDQVMRDTTIMPSIVPMVDGGVQLEWHSRGIDFEIEVGPSGRFYAHYERRRDNIEWEGELDQNLEKLNEAIRFLS